MPTQTTESTPIAVNTFSDYTCYRRGCTAGDWSMNCRRCGRWRLDWLKQTKSKPPRSNSLSINQQK